MMSTPTPRRGLLAAAMIAGPLLVVIGHAFTVPPQGSADVYLSDLLAHRASAVTGGLLTAAGALLMIPAAIGLLQLTGKRGRRLATIGGVLAGIGAAGLAVGDAMITLIMGTLAPADRALAARVFHLASNSSLAGAPFVLAPALFLGLILIAAALIRARGVPMWQPILIIAGGVVAFAAPSGKLPGALANLPLAVAIIALGLQLLRQAHEPATPAATAVTAAAHAT
jgi:hypothetical protein